jgi:PAS domain S-box-containing protein
MSRQSPGTSRLGGGLRLNIGPRLTLCFALIVLSMFGGDAVVLWQFHTVRLQADRSNGFDQELAAVLRAHASLLAFHDRLESIADDEDAGRLVTEAGPMNSAILRDAERAQKDLSNLPSGIQPDPTILPTLQVIQRTIQSQLEEITNLANMGDWSAVRLRLANQVQPLEFLSTTLVEKVDREASKAQAQAALNITQVQRRVFLVVPITVLFTLLIAGTLGLAITRSITQPLARLVEGSRMLAKGEFQYQVDVAGNDELAHLGHVFNHTAGQLQDLYARLQGSEDRLRRVIDTIPAHVWSTLPDGSVDFINQRLLESTGLSAKELLGSGWHSIVCPDDLAKYVDEWQLALSLGKTTESEVRVLTAHQDYRWMLIRNVPLRDRVGNIVKWYGTGIDIEDRKRAEEQLRRSEAYLAEAQRLSRTGSFGWLVSTGETLWSDETYHIFGYEKTVNPSLERVIHRTHPEDKELVRQFLQNVSSEKASFDAELRLLMPDDEVKYLHVVAHMMTDSSGLNECIGAVTDISPAKQAAEDLRKAQSDLAHVNRITTMGELSASLAHEVNQPIAGAVINASTCLRWLKREAPDLDEARESASRTIRDVNRAAEIISRIKLFFKKGTLQTESVDLNEIMREMTVLLRNEATRHSVSVRTELTADLPPVIGDRIQLQQVLMNLMVNGIDAMKNVDGPRQLTLHSERGENEQLLVSVGDTGVGIPPHQADQIFNAFFTTKSHGTGMGLRISRTIIAAHGGRLWATDNHPRGALFQFTLATKAKAKSDKSERSLEGTQ